MATALIGFGAAAAVSHYALQKAKKNLARYLAEAMSEFLEVDPAQIESKLLSPSSQLVLSNIRIKPTDVMSSIRQEGVVDKIEFTWKWGGSKDGSTAFVRDAQLVVTGARIRHFVRKSGGRDDQQQTSMNEHETCADEKQAKADETTSSYLQQILDHLTLKIMDLHVLVEVQADTEDEAGSGAGSYGVALEAQAIKLVSLGRDVSNHDPIVRSDTGETWEEIESPLPPPLLQTISIEQVCSYLVDKQGASPEKDKMFVIEPFGYAADVKRVAGERFSGLDFGLDIAGSMIPVPGQEDRDPVVTLHAGTKQIQTLLQIFDIVSTSSSDDSGVKEASPEAPTEQALYSTSFVLNLPSVILVLPNDATIQTFFWCLRQRADGSVNNIQAKGAVTVNGSQSFVLLEDNRCFHADFTTNKIFLQASEEEAESPSQVQHLARATWQESEMTKVMEGIRQVALLVNFDYNDEKQNTLDASSPPPPPPPASTQEPPWSFEAKDGIIYLKVEGQNNKDGAMQWVEASLDSPSVVLSDCPDELPKEVSFLGATLGPTSFGDVKIRMGSMELKTDSFKRASIDDMQSFINRALGFSSW